MQLGQISMRMLGVPLELSQKVQDYQDYVWCRRTLQAPPLVRQSAPNQPRCHGAGGSWPRSTLLSSGRATWLPSRDALKAVTPASTRPLRASHLAGSATTASRARASSSNCPSRCAPSSPPTCARAPKGPAWERRSSVPPPGSVGCSLRSAHTPDAQRRQLTSRSIGNWYG